MKNIGLVITGLGVVSPVGIGRERFWQGLIKGEAPIRDITLFDTGRFQVKKACELVDFNPLDFIEKRHLRTLDRSTRLLIAATQIALDDAALEVDQNNTHYIGITTGSTFGSLHSIFQFDREGLTEGPRYVNPSLFPNTVINSPSSQAAIRFNIKGFNTTISNGFCASLDALVYASDFLRLGRARVSLVAGVEELCEELFMGFSQLGLLSGMDGGEPFLSPFDKNRNGTVLSEGAAVLVVETIEHARKRNAPVMAEILSYASTFDNHQWEGFSSSRGLEDAIQKAMSQAGVSPHDIDLVLSSANSTRELDELEARAIKRTLYRDVPVTAIKSVLGETYSASGAFLLVTAASLFINELIPPTSIASSFEPDCELNLVRERTSSAGINRVLVIGADPFGNSTAIILKRYEQ
ncbi:MAG: beta-ketoacyl-[acyl-carrier-protein] synthase family protein [Nitrospirae bacterium]|nr:MAG: beta-ketoacyl-[acyl-carrier-protein] synthase family protein [Nitrospirota bacterium]